MNGKDTSEPQGSSDDPRGPEFDPIASKWADVLSARAAEDMQAVARRSLQTVDFKPLVTPGHALGEKLRKYAAEDMQAVARRSLLTVDFKPLVSPGQALGEEAMKSVVSSAKMGLTTGTRETVARYLSASVPQLPVVDFPRPFVGGIKLPLDASIVKKAMMSGVSLKIAEAYRQRTGESFARSVRLSQASLQLSLPFAAIGEQVASQVSAELAGSNTGWLRFSTTVNLRAQAQRVQGAARQAAAEPAEVTAAVREITRASTAQQVPLDHDGLLASDAGRVQEWVRSITVMVLERIPARDWAEEAVVVYVWLLVWSICLALLINYPLPDVVDQLLGLSGMPVTAAGPATVAAKIARKDYRGLNGGTPGSDD